MLHISVGFTFLNNLKGSLLRSGGRSSLNATVFLTHKSISNVSRVSSYTSKSLFYQSTQLHIVALQYKSMVWVSNAYEGTLFLTHRYQRSTLVLIPVLVERIFFPPKIYNIQAS